MKKINIDKIVQILKKETKQYPDPMGTLISIERSPFKLLISTMLSARTRDSVTMPVVKALFFHIKKPKDLADMPIKNIEKRIKRLGLYPTKARNIKATAKIIHEKYHDKVPRNMEKLLELPGVGRKTANLVRSLSFKIPGITVDTHVHRISNQLDLVKTKTPEQTEKALMKILPKKYWIIWNDLLVKWGQNNSRKHIKELLK